MAIRVLMLSDAEGSYTEAGERFGLTELIKALEEGGCVVTKAHRWNAGMAHVAGAQIPGFRFDNAQHFDPDDYDEVWLMGFASATAAGPYKDPAGFALSDAEVSILGAFMNGGGGVFATGDHDDLGVDLCGKVPRVRSMRRWTTDYAWWQQVANGANPETVVPTATLSPPPVGPYRLDTLVTGQNTHYEFQDQSDDVPQKIDPVMHVIRQHVTHVAGGTISRTEKVPHPLLCGPNGVIDVLPDHMHEGRCEVPQDLTKTFTIDGAAHDEYPARPDGTRISPEVAAWGRVFARVKDASFDDPQETIRDSNTNVNAADFPVIVAYNGHRAGVGRVVVDSTFHHFVNINVTGVKSEFSDEPDPATPTNAQGFPASAAGQAAHAKIKAYWRNIAVWIARPSVLRARAWQMFRDVAMDPRLKQTVPLGDAARLPTRLLTRYGAAAWSLMLRRASTCTVISWAIDIAIPDPLSYLLAYPVYVKRTLPDPPPEEQIRRDLAVDKLELIHYALGAALLELRQPDAQALLRSGSLGHLDAERGLAIVQRGALAGVRRGLRDQAARMERTLAAMRRALALSERVGSDARAEPLDAEAAAGALAAGARR